MSCYWRRRASHCIPRGTSCATPATSSLKESWIAAARGQVHRVCGHPSAASLSGAETPERINRLASLAGPSLSKEGLVSGIGEQGDAYCWASDNGSSRAYKTRSGCCRRRRARLVCVAGRLHPFVLLLPVLQQLGRRRWGRGAGHFVFTPFIQRHWLMSAKWKLHWDWGRRW
jgi:hypothetical protein